MKPTLLAAALLAAAFPLASAPIAAAVTDHGDASAKAAVVAAIDAWRAALIKGDRAGLERAYHDDLAYGHSDGALLDKAAQIDRSVGPTHVFTAVDVANQIVRVYGNVAYVTVVYTFHQHKPDGTEAATRLASLDVWTRSARGWQLIARQLTRPAS